MPELAHVVFYVRDLARSTVFYTDIVGLSVKGRIFNDRAALLSGGRSHHELLLIQVGDAPGPLTGRRLGLYHVAWKLGESIADLRAARDRCMLAGQSIEGMANHTVSQSLYLHDPDGNEVELFIDDPNYDWNNDDSWMEAPVKPLLLE